MRRFYVKEAEQQLASLSSRLEQFGFEREQLLDVRGLATNFLDCIIVEIPQLTASAALQYLAATRQLTVDEVPMSSAPLSGALFMSADGVRRWIFLDKNDSEVRRRFTIAHEIGHLVLEAESETAASSTRLELGFGDIRIRMHARCQSPERLIGSSRWTERDRSEFAANHFAAELLMPYQLIRTKLFREGGLPQTSDQLRLAVRTLAEMCGVSVAAAEKRLVKDLGIRSREDDPNLFLF